MLFNVITLSFPWVCSCLWLFLDWQYCLCCSYLFIYLDGVLYIPVCCWHLCSAPWEMSHCWETSTVVRVSWGARGWGVKHRALPFIIVKRTRVLWNFWFGSALIENNLMKVILCIVSLLSSCKEIKKKPTVFWYLVGFQTRQCLHFFSWLSLIIQPSCGDETVCHIIFTHSSINWPVSLSSSTG